MDNKNASPHIFYSSEGKNSGNTITFLFMGTQDKLITEITFEIIK